MSVYRQIKWQERKGKMDKKEAIAYLEKSLEEIPRLKKLPYRNGEYVIWINTIKGIVEKVFGVDSFESKKLAPEYKYIYKFDESYQSQYEKIVNKRALAIISIIKINKTMGTISVTNIGSKIPTAFIAHEGETENLKKLKDFLDALTIEYYIAEAEPSDGRSIEGQVNWNQLKADFAICLATKGKAINKETGEHYMGLNVADELGRAREIYKNKIILLVEDGVEVHTNTREIVHATFSNQSMDTAFIKIIKELSNWGFIQVGKT